MIDHFFPGAGSRRVPLAVNQPPQLHSELGLRAADVETELLACADTPARGISHDVDGESPLRSAIQHEARRFRLTDAEQGRAVAELRGHRSRDDGGLAGQTRAGATVVLELEPRALRQLQHGQIVFSLPGLRDSRSLEAYFRVVERRLLDAGGNESFREDAIRV